MCVCEVAHNDDDDDVVGLIRAMEACATTMDGRCGRLQGEIGVGKSDVHAFFTLKAGKMFCLKGRSIIPDSSCK